MIFWLAQDVVSKALDILMLRPRRTATIDIPRRVTRHNDKRGGAYTRICTPV
jgi:hypothetical protein